LFEDDIPAGRQAKKLPVVLSRDEVARFLRAVDNLKHRVILTVCYATGLRISEAVRLRPAAIDSKRMVIRVEQGKGRKDRYVMMRRRSGLIDNSVMRRTAPQGAAASSRNGVVRPEGHAGRLPQAYKIEHA
jgi:integrase